MQGSQMFSETPENEYRIIMYNKKWQYASGFDLNSIMT